MKFLFFLISVLFLQCQFNAPNIHSPTRQFYDLIYTTIDDTNNCVLLLNHNSTIGCKGTHHVIKINQIRNFKYTIWNTYFISFTTRY